MSELKLDIERRSIRRHGQEVFLTDREFKLLKFLMDRPGVFCTATSIAKNAWDKSPELAGLSNLIQVYVRYVREKIGYHRLKGVRGLGYYYDQTDTPGHRIKRSALRRHNKSARLKPSAVTIPKRRASKSLI